ncbi:LysE family transporter [uncultured Algibacter sp.]|uniref:LysE family transporter n=1 Tax=uncultured Algibacter sp. TaxID=298659 RepID=UPI003216C0EB
MIFVYLLLGLLTSTLGALPLGASNIAVINTTLKENVTKAFKIALAAGIAEVILSFCALQYNMMLIDFFNHNTWLQVIIIFALGLIGLYLFFKKHSETTKRIRLTQSKYATGFFLGILNPPVLIYWVIAFSIINNKYIMLSLHSSFVTLLLFFLGVYLGKLLTLYLYSICSKLIKNKVNNTSVIVNKITGVLLVLVAFFQAVKLYI